MNNRIGLSSIDVVEEIDLSQPAYTTPAPIRQMVIHADAGNIFHDDASKTDFVPILSEAMKEIIDGERKSPTKKSTYSIAQPEDQAHFPTYVTVAVSPLEPITSSCADKENTSERNIHQVAPEGNENQNNSNYQRIIVQEDSNKCQVITSNIQYSDGACDGNTITVHNTDREGQGPQSSINIVTLRPSDSLGHGVNIEAPVLNGYQKPKMNIVQQIVAAFNASDKKEMHPSEVYEEVQMIFPYYRQLSKKTKKSWMSSVRHALTSSRFKGRRGQDENPKSVIRKGSLWSLNEQFNADGNTAVRKRSSSHRKSSSRRKQKLAGRTRQDLEDIEQLKNTSPLCVAPPAVFTPAAPQLPHMQSTFAPGPMVFPNYPVMGYMHHQSSPGTVCQHPMPGQSWMTMQPFKPGDNEQCTPQSIHMPPQQIQQLTTNVATHPESVNLVHHTGQHFQMQAQGPDGGHVIFQNVNMVPNTNNNQSSQLQTITHPQHFNQLPIGQQNGYQTNVHFQPTQQPQHNTSDLHPVVNANQPATMVTTLQPQNCVQPSGNFVNFPLNQLGYGSPLIGAQTSMNWTYAQPSPQQIPMGHQQLGIHCSPGRPNKNINGSIASSDVAVPTSIYSAINFNQQTQVADAARSSPPAVTYSNNISYPSVSSQGVHLVTASGQYVHQFDNSTIPEVESELSG